MIMKTFSLGDTLLIGAAPKPMSDAEAQALFEKIEEWFSRHDGDSRAIASGARRAPGDDSYFEDRLTSQTLKDK
jgi:hypothetical protein